ncbi:FAD-dependent oxidoreductase [Roseomonas haemaphysalidis]|uniref:FAD-dependent oxidoreductase n=1 Tax=Roseomonas haemaphysalidis TaxID=2768162 RepID=A0ABS3KPP3_9PROT|nr:FAD-dependent oxidoreductase [Roseomonas haemaphysalidis]MBO1079406.1 FAD-dependent oxidoreductase [Roseomonas haemaphysalidis]
MPNALVLGAGIMGLCTAWGLTRAGWSVTVLEQDAVPNPRGSSVDAHRLIRHAYGAEAGYQRMVDAGFAAWDLLWAELGESHFVPTGVLALASAAGGWLADSRATLRAAGHAVEDLPPAAIPARFPMLRDAGVVDALATRPGGVLLARPVVAALARHLAARGVRFEQGRAARVDPARAALVLDGGGTRQADWLVLAAGPWAPRLLPELRGEVVASRQIVVDLEPPAAHRAAWAAAPMLLDLSPDGGFYAVPPVAGTALKIGDHRFSRRGDAEQDSRAATPAEAEAILALARPRLADAAGYRVLGARACYYDVEEAERFVVRPLGDRAIVMSGFSGHGFKFGAVLGLAVAAAAGDAALAAALPRWAAGQAPPPPGMLPDCCRAAMPA